MRPCHNAVHSRLADLRGAWLAASTLGRAVRCTGKGSHSQPFMTPPPWMPSRRHGSDRASRLTGTFASGAAEPKAAAADARQAGARRRRLDEVCQELYPQHSRNLLQSWIIQGKVLVNDRVVNKAGHAVPKGATVTVMAEEPRFVCRAGYKLEAALDAFSIDVAGLHVLDAGLSTGGFTDCLLQRGAQQVFGVDVGYGQVADKVRRDARVLVMERTNLRHLRPADLPCQVDMATLDLSFISVTKVLPAVVGVLQPSGGAQLVLLIKPQFEAGRAQVSAGGVVRDPKVHEEVIANVTAAVESCGLKRRGLIESPLKGDRGGNTEFLAHFVHDATLGVPLAAPHTLLLAAASASDESAEAAQGSIPTKDQHGRSGLSVRRSSRRR